jgi:UDP-N-acetylmuramyl tripeptide synthase
MLIAEAGETYEYTTLSDNLFNVYNIVAIVTLLRQLGFNHSDLQQSFQNVQIVNTRFTQEKFENIEIITNLSKGSNPVACTRAIDYAANDIGEKSIILLLADLHDEVDTSENMTWLYDIDFDFLNKDDIKQIVISGKRVYDILLRLLLAKIPKEKITVSQSYDNIVNDTLLTDIEKIFILHDLYACDLAGEIKKGLKERIEERE